MIEIGEVAEVTIVVSERDTARALTEGYDITSENDIYANVLATTKMIALMELAAGRIVQKVQRHDELSVGTALNVRHLGATPVGAEVKVIAIYLGKTGNSYNFKVEAFDIGGKIGEGTHARAIIGADKLLKRANERISNAHLNRL